MFDAKPGCWMYKQGSFITGFFPEDIVADLDANVGVFGFPPADGRRREPRHRRWRPGHAARRHDNAKTVMKSCPRPTSATTRRRAARSSRRTRTST
jgi:hypothetical protein